VRATVIGVPGSHPTAAAELMLDRKGIERRRLDLVAGLHRVVVRGMGFPRATVPAIVVDGVRLQGTRTIALALDAMQPDPPLLPADLAHRDAVLAADGWADEVLQPVARRLAWAGLRRDRSTLESYLEDAHLGIPPHVAALTAAPVIHLAARLNRAGDDAVQRDLRRLPLLLDRVDALLAEGVIGGAEPNLADFQIATSTRLLLSFDDVRGLVERRPAGAHALAVVQRFPGRLPAVFPPEWLPAAAA
jgi:glutathione S-transferase